jgi:putative membrane protein
MGRLFLKWIVLAVSVYLASLATQALGLGFEASAKNLGQAITLMIGVAVLAFLNVTLGKILKLIALPLTCATLGLFALAVNAFVFWIAASLELGFRITKEGGAGFMAAFVASVLVSLINGMLQQFLPDPKKDD